jgi:hypothetical protein
VADLEAQLAKAGKPAAKSAKMPARKTPRKG